MITVVNMIPGILSSEENYDSEPNISVNPANPLQIAATAFTPDPSGKAPIYVSTDGGNNWQLNAIVPHGNKVSGTGDITIRFATKGNALYAGDLRGDTTGQQTQMDVLDTLNFTANTTMKQLDTLGPSASGPDQPWVEAATVSAGAAAGKDRVFVGFNNLGAPGGKTASIDFSLDAKAASPTFSRVVLEKRSTGSAGQDGFQIRTTIHSSGVIYAVFYGWRSRNATTDVATTDVVIVRDDNWGQGASPFTALKDPADSLSGLRVVKGVTISINGILGLNRMGGDLAIDVDPNDSKTVYLVYGDQAGSVATLHVRRSNDKGATWSADLLTVQKGVLPGIAINASGEIGLLYQQVTGAGVAQKWETHFRQSSDGNTWSDALLSKTPANAPPNPNNALQPYLGDYNCLKAVGSDFYGVFCANNTPDKANFPSGVKFLRKANFTTKKLLPNSGTANVKISIDPFFFKVSGSAGSGTPSHGSGTPSHGSGTPSHGSGTPSHGSGTPAHGSGTPSHGTGTPAHGSGTPSHGSGTPAHGSGTPSHGSGTPAHGSGTPSHGSGTPSHGSGTPAHGSGTPAHGSGTPAHGCGTPSPGSGTPSPGSGTPSNTATPPTRAPHKRAAGARGKRMVLAPWRK